jgi:hypothetical protein
MINLQKLYPIWSLHKYSYEVFDSFIKIDIEYKSIIICNDMTFKYISTIYNSRKNCFISKSKPIIKIYIHENYIKSIIRSRYLNTLLND